MRGLATLLLGCALIPNSAEAQRDTLEAANRDWSLRINPTALIDPCGPSSLQLGIEHALSPRYSVSLEGRYYFQYLTDLDEAPSSEFSGYGAGFQLIRWSRDTHDGTRAGYALDVAYKYTEGTCRDSIKPDSAAHYSKDYHLTRDVLIIRGYGVLREDWGGRFWGEAHLGLGMRLKHCVPSGITDEELDDIDNRDENGDSSDIPRAQHATGTFWTLDVVLGFRIGYLLH
jgi:hypothetical protein